MTEQPNVVLIHDAFADGSCWSAVIEDLQSKGYEVTAPQFPQTSLADDVARLRQVLAWLSGPTILVGPDSEEAALARTHLSRSQAHARARLYGTISSAGYVDSPRVPAALYKDRSGLRTPQPSISPPWVWRAARSNLCALRSRRTRPATNIPVCGKGVVARVGSQAEV